MAETHFIGRKEQQDSLEALLHKKTASLVVIRGRRRIGKSRLIEEFSKGKRFLEFSGLPPTKKTTAESERKEFSQQLSRMTNLPEVMADDWSKLFILLAEQTKKGRVVISFDEITWMATKDPDFLGKLKNAWDMYFSKNPKLILILCGSVSAWIEKNILNSTGFFGRISLKITLEDLSIKSCNQMFKNIGFNRSSMEKLMILSVTGAIPWYIEQVDGKLSASDNIGRLCFKKDGLLVDEFKYIFSDLFGRRKDICKKIVQVLAKGNHTFREIAAKLNYVAGGALSDYLNDLLISGFVSRDFTWDLKSGEYSRLSHYRLSDNYLRFYLKYIDPRYQKIKQGQFEQSALTFLASWESIIGLQFENLVLKNRDIILAELGIRPEEVVAAQPFFQRKTTTQKGCQIDYLIQTRLKTLFACEIKFSRNEINTKVVSSVQEKLSRLSLPRGFSCVPVLIHAGDLHDNVTDADYFFKIIDFRELLEPTNQ